MREPAAGRGTGRGSCRSTRARSPSATRSARTRNRQTDGCSRSSRPMACTTATSCCATRSDAGAPPRHPPAHRPGHAARRDDAVRDLLDARGVRRAAHDRQHVLSQALLGLARPLQHHPLERAAHPDRGRRRLAAARGAVGLRDRPQRLPLDLPPRRAHRHRAGGRRGRRAGDAVAHRRRGRALPVPGLRPPGPRRARARPCRPRRDRRRQAGGSRSAPTRPRCGASAIRMPSTIWSPARRMRSRRSAATSCSTPTASRAAAPTWRCGRARRASSASPSSGSLTDPAAAERLAAKYARGVDDAAMLAPAARYWEQRHPRPADQRRAADGVAALDTLFPWLAHNAMVHLTVPHGLEQYGGAAWGTRDVCQGPVEFLLALEHDEPVKEILRIVFAQQQRDAGRLAAVVHARALRRRSATGTATATSSSGRSRRCATISRPPTISRSSTSRSPGGGRMISRRRRARIRSRRMSTKLLATVRERFIPGTHLIRYGEGDWNDSLQPADPKMRDWMVAAGRSRCCSSSSTATPRC